MTVCVENIKKGLTEQTNMAKKLKDLEELVSNPNIAEDLDKEILAEIGDDLCSKIKNDDDSRSEWLESNDKWLKLASQVMEDKNNPWPNASNVKYPLLTLAAVQFHARSLPSLINSSRPVMAKTVGQDPQGLKRKRANRVSKYMSYQVMEQMEEWLDDFDRLLMALPIIGLVYRKTYYSESLGRNRSVLIMPRDLILNYHAQDYIRSRMTHRIFMDQNELRELQLDGLFRDVELSVQAKHHEGITDEVIGLSHSGGSDDDEPFELYESHCWLDLDEDGYKEPYIVTLHADSGEVLRIVARWSSDSIQYKEDGKVRKITPDEYFTPYIFIPDPSSPVYGIGFGALLGPNNEAINTILNQLIDSGTLSNLQAGFIARGIKITSGGQKFKPGEWKIVNTTGDDLRKGVFPMPVREPSQVLFNLLGFLVDASQKVASVTDMMVGGNPGQNQPATTSMAVLEQGLKVFTSIYKRIHRQLGKEYKLLYKLNSVYLDEEHYRNVLDEQSEPTQGSVEPDEARMQQLATSMQNQMAGIEDFELDSMDICPASDPELVTETQKIVKAQSLLEKAMAGLPINIGLATRQMLEAEGHENIEQLMQVPKPQPDPEIVLKQQELQGKQQLEQAKLQLDKIRIENEAIKDKTEGMLNIAKAQQEENTMAFDQAKQKAEMVLDMADQQTKRMKIDSDERMKKYAADKKPAPSTGS